MAKPVQITGEAAGKTAVIYSRVSTLRQAEEGVSLAMQVRKARRWAEAQGVTVLGEPYSDELSGAHADNRPQLQAALDLAVKTKSMLVVYSLSRLGRSVMDLAAIADRLNRAGVELVSLSESIDTTSAAGRFFFTVLAALAQFERELVVERTREAMAHMRTQKKRISRWIPYGFRLAEDGESLIDAPDELRLIKMVAGLRTATGMSYTRLAAQMRALGAKPTRGEEWTGPMVQTMLRTYRKHNGGALRPPRDG